MPKKEEENGEVISLLQQIVKKQQEQDERLEELEETGGKRAAELRIIELIYDTPEDKLAGLTRLPMQAVRPFANAMMLHALRDPDVRSGKKSLAQCRRTAYFTLMRSVGAEQLDQGRQLARDKVQSEIERAQGPEINLGEGT